MAPGRFVSAAVCPVHGPPEVVTVESVPAPGLGPGQVRVAAGAAAVNFPDVLLIAGRYQITVPPPFIPGSEVAGEVIEVAEDVTGIHIGDRVSATALVGAFATEVVVAAGSVRRIPDGLDLPAAAALGVAHRTAMHVLRSVGRIGPGDELVVLGAGGGVGLAAVQLGSLFGASVTAVASSGPKLRAAERFGARRLIDHRAGGLRDQLRRALPDGADVVVDPVGGELAEPALRSLRWGGRFVTVGFASGTVPQIPLNLILLKGVHVLGFQFIDFATNAPDEFARNERELDGLVAAGRVVPHIGASYPLAEVAEALRVVADGEAIGKIIVEMGVDNDTGNGIGNGRSADRVR